MVKLSPGTAEYHRMICRARANERQGGYTDRPDEPPPTPEQIKVFEARLEAIRRAKIDKGRRMRLSERDYAFTPFPALTDAEMDEVLEGLDQA